MQGWLECFKQLETLTSMLMGKIDVPDKRIHSMITFTFRYGAIQPGCFQFPCSHSRAWELYANTVEPGFENSMLATRCNLLLDVKFGKCNQPPISMGYACPSDAIGRYFLETNAEYPFGKNT